jgi:glycerol-3-phosphate O-acyltransferase
MDYLVLSWVLWKRGYTVPRVAAGANLSFFPLGPLLRRLGAFFLRRSFKDDKVYTATFKAYLKKLVRDRVHQEFFPEGGRSRTGKLLSPKLGMLTWEVDAVLEGASPDLVFIPVAIDYEKVVESQSYTQELAGGEKRAEDLRGLLGARRVLTARYGRIHLSFDEPISLAEFGRRRGVSLAVPPSEETKRGLVRALGNRIMYGISRVSTVTPQALVSAALLSGTRKPLPARELAERIQILRQVAAEAHMPLSPVLANAPSDPTVMGAIQEAIRGFVVDGHMRLDRDSDGAVYEATLSGRPPLSFYKNTLMNLVAPRSIVANALRVGSGDRVEDVRARALFLSRVFKVEFIYQVGSPFEALFAQQLEALARRGVILPATETVTVAPEAHSRPSLDFLADLLRDYVESYWLAARALEQLPPDAAVERRVFVRGMLDYGRQLLARRELHLPETLSRPVLENALTFFVDQKLAIEEGRSVRCASTDGPRTLAAALGRYLSA